MVLDVSYPSIKATQWQAKQLSGLNCLLLCDRLFFIVHDLSGHPVDSYTIVNGTDCRWSKVAVAWSLLYDG